MSKGLTTSQKSLLVKAYRANSTYGVRCPAVRGEALERRGYGTYNKGLRLFLINEAGRAYGRDGVQLEGI